MSQKSVRKQIILLIGLLAPWAMSAQVLWPGDVNDNGVVNGVDALYWASAVEETGPERVDQNTDWEATPFIPWDQFFPDSTNLAYADCDGDGEVDDDDLEEVILENFGQQRAGAIPDVFAEIDEQNGLSLEIIPRQEVIGSQEQLELAIRLGNEERPVSDFAGLILDIVFDPDLVSEGQAAFNLDLNENWAVGEDSDLKSFVFRSEAGAGRVSLGIVREEQAPIIGAGEIGNVSIVIEDIAVGVTEAIELQFENIRVGGSELTSEPLEAYPPNARVLFDHAVTSDLEPNEIEETFRLYPNPARQEITVEFPNAERWDYIELLDVQGKSWAQFSTNGQGRLALPVGDFPAGPYILRIVGGQKIKNLRFLLAH